MFIRVLLAGVTTAMAAAVAVAPPAEAAATPPKIVKISHKSNFTVPASGTGTFTMTVKTSGTVKAVCVAVGYYDTKNENPGKRAMVKAAKKSAGSWVLTYKYNLEKKYSAFSVSVAADNDTNCADTVSPTARLRDKTMDARIGRVVNFFGQHKVTLKASATSVKKGQNVTFTATVSPVPYAGRTEGFSARLVREIGHGWVETVANFWCRDGMECGYSVGNGKMSREVSVKINATGSYYVMEEARFWTAFDVRDSYAFSKAVTVKVA